MSNKRFVFRDRVRKSDLDAIQILTASSGFFSPEEIDLAVELVAEALRLGSSSGYNFILAEEMRRVVGYTCFGPIPCTQNRFDLYWIVVLARLRGHGLGRDLLARTEAAAKALGAVRMYAETSSRPLYAPTRAFYLARGYGVETVLPGFYADNDDKLVYRKDL
jgi:GNAT superfamily N-acetyltransferase